MTKKNEKVVKQIVGFSVGLTMLYLLVNIMSGRYTLKGGYDDSDQDIPMMYDDGAW